MRDEVNSHFLTVPSDQFIIALTGAMLDMVKQTLTIPQAAEWHSCSHCTRWDRIPLERQSPTLGESLSELL